MPPEDKLGSIRAKLNQNAVNSVLSNPRDKILPTPSTPDTDELAFANEVYRYLSGWITAHHTKCASARPFAFVLSRSISEDEELLKARCSVPQTKTYEAFKNQKMVDVTGQLILTTMNLEKAVTIAIDDVCDAQVLLNAIKTFGLTNRHVAAFEPPAANLLILKPEFSSSRSLIVEKTSALEPWSLKELEAEVEKFHSTFTRAPSGFLVPWKSAKKGQTGDQLEVRISKYLAYELGRMWSSGSVLAEVATQSGRIDVFLHSIVLEDDKGPCILEVKVLRSHSNRRKLHTQLATWWAEKGVVQASIYRQDMAAPTAYLLCFDARETDTQMAEVEALAKTMDVRYEKYFMYRSSDDLQAAEKGKVTT
ncbi:hypothetical protein ACU4GH_36870 [Bradyrhizobium betae]